MSVCVQASCKSDENAVEPQPEVSEKKEVPEGSKGSKAGSKLNLSPQEVEEVLAVLRYRTRPATPPLKDQTNEPTSVHVALVKGAAQLPKALDRGAKNKHLHESKQTAAPGVVDKADKLLQAILRPSQEADDGKPTGLDRLKHLFNKTISVSAKEVAQAEVSP